MAGGYGVTHNADSLRDRLALLIAILLLLTIAGLVDLRVTLLHILARDALLLLMLVRVLRALLILLVLTLPALLLLLRPVLLLLLVLRLLVLTIGHLQVLPRWVKPVYVWGTLRDAVTPPPSSSPHRHNGMVLGKFPHRPGFFAFSLSY